jgi:hypothetical protein
MMVDACVESGIGYGIDSAVYFKDIGADLIPAPIIY